MGAFRERDELLQFRTTDRTWEVAIGAHSAVLERADPLSHDGLRSEGGNRRSLGLGAPATKGVLGRSSRTAQTTDCDRETLQFNPRVSPAEVRKPSRTMATVMSFASTPLRPELGADEMPNDSESLVRHAGRPYRKDVSSSSLAI